MPTLASYATRVHTRIGAIDNGYWSVDLIKAWIKEALEQWPILKPVTLAVTAGDAGQTTYELDNKIQHIIRVYHVNEDCEFARGTTADWDSTGKYYYFINRHDDTVPNELKFSEGAGLTIDSGHTFQIEAMSQHEYQLADEDAVTVPSHQLYLLQKLVTTIALENRLTYYSQNLSQADVEWLTQVVSRLKREFKKEVQDTPDPITLSPYVQWELSD